MRKALFYAIWPLMLICLVSCSASGFDNPTMTPNEDTVRNIEKANGTEAIVGIWQITIDKTSGEADIVLLRTGDMLLNVLSFMEPPALKSLDLDWNTLILNPKDNYLEAVVKFTHPFVEPKNVFMGFDVRGIVFGPRLLDADGYTPALSPEYFSGFPFGYIDGLLGAPNSWAGFDGVKWPYKYFAIGINPYESLSDYYANPSRLLDRGQFPEGKTISRLYQLDFSNYPGSFLVFNYAVLASFGWPTGAPSYTLDDFSIENCNTPEPFNASISITENSLYYGMGSGGGTISLDAEVYDWQNPDDVQVSLVSSDGITIPDTPADSSEPGSTEYSRVYHFIDVPATPQKAGNLELCIRATDPTVTYGECWMFGCMPTSNEFYNVPVYNIFSFPSAVSVYDIEAIKWDPVLNLADGYGTLCRTSEPYPDSHSAYSSKTLWDYTGGEPEDPEGMELSKWYYISTSPDTQTGSPFGWVRFDTIGNLEVDWNLYSDLAPDRLYLWVRAKSEDGRYSKPERWVNDGGEMEFCRTIAGWDNNFDSDWTPGGYYGYSSQWLYLYVAKGGHNDSWLYTDTSWQLGDPENTSAVKIEFSRLPSEWVINTNNLSFRVSPEGGMQPSNIIETWSGTIPQGGPVTLELPETIGGTPTIGSTRAFGWYLADISSTEGGAFYVDYMGIYAHPI